MSSERIVKIPGEYISNVFGKFDENIQALERKCNVTIVNREDSLIISGTAEDTDHAEDVLHKLIAVARSGENVTLQHVNYLSSLSADEAKEDVKELLSDVVCFTKQGKPIRPKTLGQKRYVDQIRKHTLTFGVGPAGTGKTFLAMAMAVQAFKQDEISRIILTRPAIEAGEKLGFLPGDLQSKIDPYLRPLYDALYEMMGPESVAKNLERGVIEVAPLAYMRGRTLDNSFIVLDEAQNTTQAQMKMFLTRIGFNSKVVVTGDLTQIDLPDGQKSGLRQAVTILCDVEDIGITRLNNQDVVRHPLVQRIVEAYEKGEHPEAAKGPWDKKDGSRRKG